MCGYFAQLPFCDLDLVRLLEEPVAGSLMVLAIEGSLAGIGLHPREWCVGDKV